MEQLSGVGRAMMASGGTIRQLVDDERVKATMGDTLIDLDYALAKIGIQHREMEMADAYYMVMKHNEQMEALGKGPGED
jgi:hypothetical protein